MGIVLQTRIFSLSAGQCPRDFGVEIPGRGWKAFSFFNFFLDLGTER